MSVTLRLVHRAGYTYSGPAVASYNEARMVPKSTLAQTVSHTRLEITPTPWQDSWIDYWGTNVTTFELHEPHAELKVVAISTVTVHRGHESGEGAEAPGRHLGWDEVAAQEVVDDLGEYLDLTGHCTTGAAFAALVDEVRALSQTPAQFVDDIVERIHRQVGYRRERFAHASTADKVWNAGKGGSIDLAHLTIAALRAAGIPARFVIGYLLPDRTAEIGEVISGHGHCWIEWWDGEWVAFDPAVRTTPDDFYIEVAHGRDHTDVAPLRGIFTGTPGSKMSVTVEISRLA
ncbi:transglutaminase family protein [Calidifontibacter indicus]|uniref:transglutaminase family protein n=1 Tax=Calidifontibacter indicus TaxID=419650 RepID=UPI003D71F397